MTRILYIWTSLLIVTSGPTVYAASVILNPGDDVRTLTGSLQAGDVIQFNSGTFEIPEYLRWVGVGTETAPITLRASDGATPVLQYGGTGGGTFIYVGESEYLLIEGLIITGDTNFADHYYNGMQIYDSKNVTLKNCEIRNVGGTGLYLSDTNNDIIIENNQIHDVSDGNGIYIGTWDGSQWATGCIIKNNWIYNIHGDGHYGIYMTRGNYGNTFVDNNIHTVDHRGVGFAQYTSTDPETSPNIFERNAVWNVGSNGLDINGSAIVRNNIVFDTGAYGIYSVPADDDAASNLIITNNTVQNTVEWAIYYRHRLGRYTLANNALCNPVGYAFRGQDIEETDVESVAISHNIATGLVDTFEALEAGFLPGAGLDDFADASIFDYWPASGSHLIDAGTDDPNVMPPTDDFNGLQRSNGTIDAGAYERSAESNPGWIIRESFKEPTTELADAPVTTEAGCGSCSSAEGSSRPSSELVLVSLLTLWLIRPRWAART